ncbi:hypothetical protein K3495_g6685 [Podosphaera aphanis]|nr:hypothetical protein K3495_g6685 [Podosphaera aphanis]
MHCASLVQSVIISLLTIYIIATDEERWYMNVEERIWGYTGAAALVQALACGYFLFDFIAMVRYYEVFGLAMLIHAISCLTTYILGFWPICNYYGCVFMLFELSTPFLNIHWFFDKLGMTGSKAQLYNGLTLLFMFFSARLVWGAFATVYIYGDIWQVWHLSNQLPMKSSPEMMRFAPERILPKGVILLYMVGHITLYSLNVFWFNKMIAAVRKRFSKTDEKKPQVNHLEARKEI